MKKECILYDRECINCGECDMCDLDPKKVCDNCGKCIESGDDYNIIDVDLTSENGDEPLNYHYEGEETAEDDEIFVDEDFEDDFDDEDIYDEDEDDDDDENLEFDFGEFFGQR
jgi:hypothetical protein